MKNEARMIDAEKQRFFFDHLPHRVNVLIAFRERYSGRNPARALNPEQFRDLFRCAKDIAMLMACFFCWEVGLDVPRGKNTIELCDPKGSDDGALKVDVAALRADSRAESLRLVLIAANRAVAHIKPDEVDHGVSDPVLISAIDLVEELIRSHIYKPNNVSLDAAMRNPNNKM
jgi:hypothetical protein